MVQVHLITSHLLSLRTFAEGCVIHILTQHDQGYMDGTYPNLSANKSRKKRKKKLIRFMVQVHLITSHLLSVRTFAEGCVIHILTQHDQGYR